MAGKNKGDSGGSGRTNKFRFVYFEGDLSDTNMSELAHVLTNAMRPTPAPAPRLTSGPIATIPTPAASNGDTDEGPAEGVDDQLEEAAVAPANPRAPRRDRRYPMPKYLHDVDLSAGEVSFLDYIEGKSANKHSKRYLLVASWFKEYGGRQSVTVDHVYTAYKKAGWTTKISDWDLVLRQLVKHDRMRRVESGEYAITPHGEDMVNNLAKPEEQS